jgi:hypothetical protein
LQEVNVLQSSLIHPMLCIGEDGLKTTRSETLQLAKLKLHDYCAPKEIIGMKIGASVVIINTFFSFLFCYIHELNLFVIACWQPFPFCYDAGFLPLCVTF